MPLCSILLCFFSRVYTKDSISKLLPRTLHSSERVVQSCTHHLTCPETLGHPLQLIHIIWEPELFQGFGDVLARDRFLRLFLCDIVGFGRQHLNELDTTFDEQVAGIFGEGHVLSLRFWWATWVRGEDFVDDLLHGRYMSSVSFLCTYVDRKPSDRFRAIALLNSMSAETLGRSYL